LTGVLEDFLLETLLLINPGDFLVAMTMEDSAAGETVRNNYEIE
jgi:hypothetical protein